MADKETKVKFKVDITPPGWMNYSIEDMTRAAVWVIRRFATTEDIRVLDCRISGSSLEATLEVSSSAAMSMLSGIPAQLRALAEIPLAPCPCGCGVDLSVTECVRDELEQVKDKRLNAIEKDLAASGNSIGAIRAFRARTGMPLKDAADQVAKHRQALKVAFDEYHAALPSDGGVDLSVPTADDLLRTDDYAGIYKSVHNGYYTEGLIQAPSFDEITIANMMQNRGKK